MFKIAVETLEHRVLLSASLVDPASGSPGDPIWLRGGVLHIGGRQRNDHIRFFGSWERAMALGKPSLDPNDMDLVILLNGQRKSFRIGDIKLIEIDGGGGNDLIEVEDKPTYRYFDWCTYEERYTMFGEVRPALVYGGDGDDTIIGSSVGDTIYGGRGDDSIRGYDGADRIFGMAGKDDIEADEGNDYVDGGRGNDNISGNDGADTIWGRAGHDIIYGGIDHDQLFGGAGNDVFWGGDGTDEADGGPGRDSSTDVEGSSHKIEKTFDYTRFSQCGGSGWTNNG